MIIVYEVRVSWMVSETIFPAFCACPVYEEHSIYLTRAQLIRIITYPRSSDPSYPIVAAAWHGEVHWPSSQLCSQHRPKTVVSAFPVVTLQWSADLAAAAVAAAIYDQ
jgi:hypothetical protein